MAPRFVPNPANIRLTQSGANLFDEQGNVVSPATSQGYRAWQPYLPARPSNEWRDYSAGQTAAERIVNQLFGTAAGRATTPAGGSGNVPPVTPVVVSGGGGGAARPVNPDPLGWRAIQMAQNAQAAYDAQVKAQRDYLAREAERLAGRETSARSGMEAAAKRADELLAALNAANVETQGRVSGVYSAGDAALAQVMADVENALRTRAAAAGETLGMFGARPEMAMPGGTSAIEFAGAGRAALGRMGTADQAYFAGRPQAYAGLASDIATLREAAYQNIMDQIAAERAQIERDANERIAALEGAAAQAVLGIQQAEAERAGRYA